MFIQRFFDVELDVDSASKTNYNPFEWEIRLIVHIMNITMPQIFSAAEKKKSDMSDSASDSRGTD